MLLIIKLFVILNFWIKFKVLDKALPFKINCLCKLSLCGEEKCAVNLRCVGNTLLFHGWAKLDRIWETGSCMIQSLTENPLSFLFGLWRYSVDSPHRSVCSPRPYHPIIPFSLQEELSIIVYKQSRKHYLQLELAISVLFLQEFHVACSVSADGKATHTSSVDNEWKRSQLKAGSIPKREAL